MENITYEQVLALFAENAKLIRELAAENDRRAAENEKLARERAAENERLARERAAENEKLARERAAENEKSTRERAAEADKRIAETDKQLKILAKQVGEITDSLGRFAEEQVRPKVLEMFQARGIELEETLQRVQIKKDGNFFAEIDLLLVNTIYSVAVEVKHTLRQKDIDEHLERLAKLQQYPSHCVKGTTMFGAVAGMIVMPEAEIYAIKQGLYVLTPSGESMKISNKPDFEPKQWEVVSA